MSGRYHVQAEACRAMAQLHADASSGLVTVSDAAPQGVDGGLGTAALESIVAALDNDAAALADINTATGDNVRTAVDEFTGVDAGAAGRFSALEPKP